VGTCKDMSLPAQEAEMIYVAPGARILYMRTWVWPVRGVWSECSTCVMVTIVKVCFCIKYKAGVSREMGVDV
jgi:hypothetical protein